MEFWVAGILLKHGYQLRNLLLVQLCIRSLIMRFAFIENFFKVISHGRIVIPPARFSINITCSGTRLEELRKMTALLIGVSLVTLLIAMPASGQVDFATMDISDLTQDDNRITKLINCFLEEPACSEEERTIRG